MTLSCYQLSVLIIFRPVYTGSWLHVHHAGKVRIPGQLHPKCQGLLPPQVKETVTQTQTGTLITFKGLPWTQCPKSLQAAPTSVLKPNRNLGLWGQSTVDS